MAASKTSTPNFARACQDFRAAGIPARALIPVTNPAGKIHATAGIDPKMMGKVPGRWIASAGAWGGRYGDAVNIGLTKSDTAEAADWPTDNVGLLGRAYPGIDSDAESAAVRLVIEESVDFVFGLGRVAERLRGRNDRRLYVTRARNPEHPVRTRHVRLRMPGDPTGVWSKIDIIGAGNQYLVTGVHPSGDLYDWHPNADLRDREVHDNLVRVDDEDIERFLEDVERRVTEGGGEFEWTGNGGGLGGTAVDPRKQDRAWSNETIFYGLDRIPNNEDNFPHRENLLAFVAAIRYTAGADCDDPDLEDRVREWACADEDWCPREYFDKIWKSLRTVRSTTGHLDRVFRDNGITRQTREDFQDDPTAPAQVIERSKAKAREDHTSLLSRAASTFIFRDTNTKITGNAEIGMRFSYDTAEEWQAERWFKLESTRADTALLSDLHEEYGLSKVGFYKFVRDLKANKPDNWFSAEARNPFLDHGQIYTVEGGEFAGRQVLNTWRLSQTIKAARGIDPSNSQVRADCNTILEFGERLFGDKMWSYELRTLAYMAQTGKRPNGLLVLVGEQGVGKSIYANMLVEMFNGQHSNQSGSVDGAKLTGDAARFAFANIEGCRIVNIKEMPRGGGGKTMRSSITAMLKQLADSGRDGDFVQIEGKGQPVREVQNFARTIITTNYADSVEIDGAARRIFQVECLITESNKPEEEYYARLAAIIEDPKRLAAFYHYLANGVDISEFNAHANPPSSMLKAETVAENTKRPIDRHLRAAAAWFAASGRDLVMPHELFLAMEECAEAEYKASGGEDDFRRDYHAEFSRQGGAAAFSAAVRFMGADLLKTTRRPTRRFAGTEKFSAGYFLAGGADKRAKFEKVMNPDEAREYVLDQLDIELGEHPFAAYKDARPSAVTG